MVMQVRHRLEGVSAAVHHDAVTTPVESFLRRHPPDHHLQVAQQACVAFGYLRQGGNVPPRDDQHVHRSLRLDIPKRQHLLVLVDELGGHLPGRNAAEDATGPFRQSLSLLFHEFPAEELRQNFHAKLVRAKQIRRACGDSCCSHCQDERQVTLLKLL